jgi:hypothetical protein
MCIMSGGCKWHTIKEEWIPRAEGRPYSQLVRFSECSICGDTRATLTSPNDAESLFSVPSRYNLKAQS